MTLLLTGRMFDVWARALALGMRPLALNATYYVPLPVWHVSLLGLNQPCQPANRGRQKSPAGARHDSESFIDISPKVDRRLACPAYSSLATSVLL